MAKVELMGPMAYVQGWNEARDRVEEKMKDWPELEQWTVRIRVFTQKDAVKFEQGDEDAYRDMDEKNKVLTLACKPESPADPEKEAYLIMSEFVNLE